MIELKIYSIDISLSDLAKNEAGNEDESGILYSKVRESLAENVTFKKRSEEAQGYLEGQCSLKRDSTCRNLKLACVGSVGSKGAPAA